MSFNEKLLARWKLCLSFMKRDWQLADYPVVVRQHKIDSESETDGSRGVQHCYLARIVNWSVMTGGGEMPDEAMANLSDQFARIKERRVCEGRSMPRPGTKVAIEFAPSTRVRSHPELTDDFIRRVLGLDWAFVSDESSLWDFHSNDSNDALNARIEEVYSVDVSDIKTGNLAEILDRIAARQRR